MKGQSVMIFLTSKLVTSTANEKPSASKSCSVFNDSFRNTETSVRKNNYFISDFKNGDRKYESQHQLEDVYTCIPNYILTK
jgi:hypothetical protein